MKRDLVNAAQKGKPAMSPNAYYPAIGIRPLIDGRRRGVRESLEEKMSQLAQDVAQLISTNLTYPDGTPVRCVIAQTAIGGVSEANACKEQFRTENVCADLTVTASWNYITEVLDLDPSIPHAIWGFNGTERPGAVTLAAPQPPPTPCWASPVSVSTGTTSRTPTTPGLLTTSSR